MGFVLNKSNQCYADVMQSSNLKIIQRNPKIILLETENYRRLHTVVFVKSNYII